MQSENLAQWNNFGSFSSCSPTQQNQLGLCNSRVSVLVVCFEHFGTGFIIDSRSKYTTSGTNDRALQFRKSIVFLSAAVPLITAASNLRLLKRWKLCESWVVNIWKQFRHTRFLSLGRFLCRIRFVKFVISTKWNDCVFSIRSKSTSRSTPCRFNSLNGTSCFLSNRQIKKYNSINAPVFVWFETIVRD